MELGGWWSYEMVLRYAHLATEQLREACGWLSKRGTGEVGAVARQIGGVVQIEDLADQGHAPSLAKYECPAEPQVQGLKGMIERVGGG